MPRIFLFLAFEWPKFSDTHVYAHIFAQILVKPLLSHLHKAGFLHRGGGGGVLWYFHTYVGSGYFLWFKILNFNIFWGFEKNEYFWGYEDFVDIFLGHHKIGLVWGSFLCILGSFLRSRYRIGIFFGVAKISNIFLGCLKFLILFWGWTVDAGSEPTYTEKFEYPPPPPPLRVSHDESHLKVC